MLVCRSCGATYETGPEEPWRCRACEHAVDFAERPRATGDPTAVDPTAGLWAFSEFLPVAADDAVSLGEGWTPLVSASEWDAEFKLDYVCPSGSYKDRGAAVLMTRAAALGVDRVVEDSSGNAGAAVAQYAARAGIDAEIYVPADAPAAKLDAMEAAGATTVPVAGGRRAVTEACVSEAVGSDAWYASHAWSPSFYAGTATVAYEIAAQRGWRAPDAVVVPVGHGTLLLGAYRGFRALAAGGWIESMPRLLGVQAAGVEPVAAAVNGSASDEDAVNEAADGIQIRSPARLDQVAAAVAATDGDVVACGESATTDALASLHEAGLYVEPTSAVAVAGLAAYRARGVVGDSDDVVVALTGSGLKKP
ncbi:MULTISPECIES: threonine synthase [Halobacterium]|uniref:threonine synthase n=1 Tax=Halobacterium TaxID=2239 RepID=UPI0019666CFC|nr:MULTISPECIES: threonine synthase [Halobacterium]MCF2165871.1 threonine synthase [Halobacterium salinarum]MCF2167360.1 threonine synthase [Halobacterium salinarum]MDL0122950.1 threonine synthase [Halobacterium salinarum]MDL0134800.1 threonine synthase [Halobacterium salinarum]QRY24384.1 threonine synthase [Halobacterium sp. BOL4-2]